MSARKADLAGLAKACGGDIPDSVMVAYEKERIAADNMGMTTLTPASLVHLAASAAASGGAEWTEDELSEKTATELKAIAEPLGIKGRSKADLVASLTGKAK